ncbi:MAG TPA: hypothetical protein VFF33_11635 [Ignavibacteriaceae bacterium]|nr:hypothetical protein [Ignavibacteriaceae bacterium]
MCYSLLMYLQDRFHVTTTTDIEVMKIIAKSGFDLVLMDIEPSKNIETFCRELNEIYKIPVILTYVYKKQINNFDSSIRKYVSSVFYKPYDLNEVSQELSSLILA